MEYIVFMTTLDLNIKVHAQSSRLWSIRSSGHYIYLWKYVSPAIPIQYMHVYIYICFSWGKLWPLLWCILIIGLDLNNSINLLKDQIISIIAWDEKLLELKWDKTSFSFDPVGEVHTGVQEEGEKRKSHIPCQWQQPLKNRKLEIMNR